MALPRYLSLSASEHDAQREDVQDVEAMAVLAKAGYPDVDSIDAVKAALRGSGSLSKELKVVFEMLSDQNRRVKRAAGNVATRARVCVCVCACIRVCLSLCVCAPRCWYRPRASLLCVCLQRSLWRDPTSASAAIWRWRALTAATAATEAGGGSCSRWTRLLAWRRVPATATAAAATAQAAPAGR